MGKMRADQVRALRDLSNLTLRAVCARAGVSHMTWLRWERGRNQKPANASRLWHLAEDLGVKLHLECLAPPPSVGRGMRAFEKVARSHAARTVAKAALGQIAMATDDEILRIRPTRLGRSTR